MAEKRTTLNNFAYRIIETFGIQAIQLIIDVYKRQLLGNGNGIRSGMNLGHTHTPNTHSQSDEPGNEKHHTLGQEYQGL